MKYPSPQRPAPPDPDAPGGAAPRRWSGWLVICEQGHLNLSPPFQAVRRDPAPALCLDCGQGLARRNDLYPTWSFVAKWAQVWLYPGGRLAVYFWGAQPRPTGHGGQVYRPVPWFRRQRAGYGAFKQRYGAWLNVHAQEG